MSGYDGDTLFSIVTGDQDLKFKEQTLSDFKAHVKRDFVDLAYVPKNFDTLIIATKFTDLEISNIAFSTICHLVKRVSIQDSTVLKHCYQNVVPCLMEKLSDSRISLKSASKKALQVYWACFPNEVDYVIKQYGLNNSNRTIQESCLQFLISLVEQHYQNFMFKPYTSKIVTFLKEENSMSTQLLAKLLLIKFFRNCTSKNAKLDLISEFMKQQIDKNTVHILLMDIDPNLIGEFNHMVNAVPQISSDDETLKFINSGSVKITTSNTTHHTLNRAKSSQTLRLRLNHERQVHNNKALDPSASDSSIHSAKTTSFGTQDPKMENLLSKIPGCLLDNIKGMRINSATDLRQNVEELLPAFSGKETEFNWTLREKNIIYMRSVIRGNSPVEFPEDLSQCLRTFCEAITKAVSSLRTSLSSNGCQLIKEMAVFLGNYLDNVTIDVCATTLLRLSGSAKKIASQNAMLAFSSLIANISHHQRVFNQIVSAAQDKNVQPRLYSSSWIQIYILRNHEILETSNNGMSLDQLGRAISKCLADPNANVRESMRSTFWCFYQYWPTYGDGFLSKLDLTTKKALDRSRPLDVATSDSTITRSPRKRQSIRELIVAKNRSVPVAPVSIQTKTIPPRSQSGGNAQGDIGKPLRVGVLQKARRVSSFKNSSLAAAGIANRSRSEEIRPPSSHSDSDSTKDIFMRAPLSNSPQIQVEALSHGSTPLPVIEVEKEHASEQQEDMIIKLLRSDSSEMKMEGISLLKYAFFSKEEIPFEVDGLLDSLSINDPYLLKPLYNLDLVPETVKHMSTDNFLRSFIISHIDSDYQFDQLIDDKLITVLVDSLSSDILYSSCAQLINTSNNVSLVINGNLTMQFIKHKRHIFKFLNLFLVKILENFPISDSSYTKICDVLFLSIDFFKTSDDESDVSNYIRLLKTLFEIKPNLFKRCLVSHGESVTDVVSSLASIKISDTTTTLLPFEDIEGENDDMMDGVQMSSLYEMTMIKPSGSLSGSHLNVMEQALNDMTMIMPNFNKPKHPNQLSSPIKENVFEEDEEDDSIYHHHGLNFQKAEKEEIQGDVRSEINIEDVEMGETKVDGLTNYGKDDESRDHQLPTEATTVLIPMQVQANDFDNSRSASPSSSRELITQIQNVNISSPPAPLSNGSDIETIITKSDPLSTLSVERSIKIYEDEEELQDEVIILSPFATLNSGVDTWYSFQLQKYSNVKLNAPVSKVFVSDLKSRCFSNKCIEDDWLLFMIIMLQSTKQIVEMDEILSFLDSIDSESDDCIYGLTILMHKLKSDSDVGSDELRTVWNLLIIKFSSHCEYFANEMWFAVMDLIQELIYKDAQLVLGEATGFANDSNQITISLFAIKIIVKHKLASLTGNQIEMIADYCSSHLNHENVVNRKLVITIFSILSQLDDKSKYLAYDESQKKLSMLQYKLIEEYAMQS